MSYFRFWHSWLLAVSVFIIAFGAIMAVANSTILFVFFNAKIDPVFWGLNPVPPPAQAFQAWVYGAWGATVLGWGITIFFVAYYPLKKQEKWAWQAVFVSVLSWYILDTGISWLFNVFINVFLNTAILILVLFPLIFIWKEMSN